MADWMETDDEAAEEMMRGPVAKRMKRSRNGEPMKMEMETDEVNSGLQSLVVDTDSSDDEALSKNELDGEPNSSGVRDQRRLEMNSAKKVKERARRGKMADSVRSLRILVPSCHDDKKVNQSQVLSNTVAYVTKLQAQLQSLHREVEQLKAQLAAASLNSEPTPSTSSFKASPQFSSRQQAIQGSGRSKTTNSSKTQFTASPNIAAPSRASESFPVIKLTTTTSRPQRQFRAAPISIISSPGGSPTGDSSTHPYQTNSNSSMTFESDMMTSPNGAGTHNDTNSISDPSSQFGRRSMHSNSNGPMMSPMVPFLGSTMHSGVSGPVSSNSTATRPRMMHNMAPISLPPRFQSTSREDSGLSSTPIGDSPFDQHFGSEDVMGSTNVPYVVEEMGIKTDYGSEVPSGMSLDDIEDVGRWPLYHNHDAPHEPEAIEMQYAWSIPPAERGHSTTSRHMHMFPHDHSPHVDAAAPSQGSSVCECGKAPVYAQYF